MREGSKTASRWTIAETTRVRAWLLALLGTCALALPAAAPAVASATTTWLCKPGLAEDPCESSEETTVELGDGSTSVEDAEPASKPPIDCFYVYPTVSGQSTINSNLEIEPEESQVAIDQASRFSQQCRVYAPMYQQLTLYALEHPEDITAEDKARAYLGVLSAFEEYLTKYSDGRGFVLIGHSQGALMLKQLIEEQIDPSATLRARLVSAIILGGNVLVPKGKIVGGDFHNIPACETAAETHCVVAYSSFLAPEGPPAEAYFGRVTSALLGPTTTEEVEKDEVLCVNPALTVQDGEAGALLRYESTTPIPGFEYPAPSAPTPWVSMPGQYTGQCRQESGASWLQLTDVGPEGDPRPKIEEVLGPLWGTHLDDVNVALGNLVGMTGDEAATYEAEQLPPETATHEPPVESPTPLYTPPPATSTSVTPPPTPSRVTAKRTASHKSCKRSLRRGRRSRKAPVRCATKKRRAGKHKRHPSKRHPSKRKRR